MTDATVSSIDLTVFGGPSSIDVDVDFGTIGPRGSRFFGVIADPRLSTTPKPVDALIFDLALVVTPSAFDYLTIYQKVGSGSEDWEALAELFPNVYSTKQELDFVGGSASFDLVLNNVFTIEDQNYNVSRFMVQLNIEDRVNETKRPVSFSTSLAVNAVADDQVLTVSINAIEYNTTAGPGGTPAWVNISGERVVHVLATVV
jgi:hypothetical protein